jgi:peptide/nickel transport system permease protein
MTSAEPRVRSPESRVVAPSSIDRRDDPWDSTRSLRVGTWARFRRRPAAVVGLVLLGALGLLALLAGVVAPSDPFRASGPPLQPPSARHWLGTDDLGRDVFAGVVHGSRLSLLVGLVAALTSGLVGTLVGSVAGYFGRFADDALMRLAELVQVVPRFFLALLVAALFGPSVAAISLLLGLTFWPSTARLLRAQVLSLRRRDFVLAARALGVSEGRVLVRHVLPNALPVVIVNTALQIGSAILVEAGLSFLGLGDRSVASWGNMLNSAQPLIRIAWWTSVFPGLAITLTVVAANLVGDGLSAALDPRLQGSAPPA